MNSTSLIFRAGLIVAGTLCLIAGDSESTKVPCTKAGLIIGVESIGDRISFKDPQGSISRITTNDQTVITKSVEGQPELAKIRRSDLENGDLICAVLNAEGTPATRVVAVSRSIIEKRQYEFLTRWQRGSVFGVIDSVDSDRRGMTMLPERAGAMPVHIAFNQDTRYRRLPAGARSVKEAASFSVSELHPGEHVYVSGGQDSNSSGISANLVAIGGNQAVAGTISSVRPLTNTVTVREIGTGRDLETRLLVSQLYRTAPMINTPTEIKTPAGVPLVSVGFGELKEGDSVLVIGSSAPRDPKMTGVILVTSFGAYGVAPDDPTGQLAWFFK